MKRDRDEDCGGYSVATGLAITSQALTPSVMAGFLFTSANQLSEFRDGLITVLVARGFVVRASLGLCFGMFLMAAGEPSDRIAP